MTGEIATTVSRIRFVLQYRNFRQQESSIVKVLIQIIFLLLLSANAQGENNDIYVVDVGPNRGPPFQVLKFDENGDNPQVFTKSELNNPQDIVFLEDSNTALVSNFANDRITKYDATTGAFIGDFSDVNGDGPTRMKIGADGLLYVLQWFGNGRARQCCVQLPGAEHQCQ